MDTALVKDLGLPIAIVVACGLFFWKGFWPWMTAQVKLAQDQSAASQRQTHDAVSAVAGLKETLHQHLQVNQEIVAILRGLEGKWK